MKLNAVPVKWAFFPGRGCGESRRRWRCVAATSRRLTWAQRNPITPTTRQTAVWLTMPTSRPTKPPPASAASGACSRICGHAAAGRASCASAGWCATAATGSMNMLKRARPAPRQRPVCNSPRLGGPAAKARARARHVVPEPAILHNDHGEHAFDAGETDYRRSTPRAATTPTRDTVSIHATTFTRQITGASSQLRVRVSQRSDSNRSNIRPNAAGKAADPSHLMPAYNNSDAAVWPVFVSVAPRHPSDAASASACDGSPQCQQRHGRAQLLDRLLMTGFPGLPAKLRAVCGHHRAGTANEVADA